MKDLSFTSYYVSYHGQVIASIDGVTGPEDLDKRLGKSNWKEQGNVLRVTRYSHLPRKGGVKGK